MSSTVYETTNVLPRVFPDMRVTIRDKKYTLLQKKMIDVGWEPTESDNSITFTHTKYGKRKFQCSTITTSEGEKLMFPIASKDNDIKGLACDVLAVASGYQSELVSNEWQSFWDTRTGKRREKYNTYLETRQAIKNSIIEDMEHSKLIPNIF